MDRPIQASVKRNTNIIRGLRWGGIAAVIIAVLAWIMGWIAPSLHRNQIRTAVVESGPMEASINASGTVTPEFEQVLSSPIDTRVLKILKKAGDSLRKDEPILLLDLESTVISLNKISDQLAIKGNDQARQLNTLENQLIKLESQIKIKKLEISSRKLKFEQNKQLLTSKAVSKNEVDQSEVDLATSEAQLQELMETRSNLQKATQLQNQGTSLEISTLQKDKQLLEQQLALATTKADRKGILTWVTLTEGAAIRKGDILARIADLNTYRVDANVSDVHASRLSVGMPVHVKIGDSLLDGMISNVLPTIENGIVKLQVSLKDKASPLLRPNLRVDVYITTDSKANTLRIKKGGITNLDGNTEIFVVRGDVAVKVPVQTGMSNFDYNEILSGLSAGEEVIISDMDRYKHLKEIKIKQ